MVFSVVSFGPESSRSGEGVEDGRELWVKADISFRRFKSYISQS